jgi:hypothetical protein
MHSIADKTQVTSDDGEGRGPGTVLSHLSFFAFLALSLDVYVYP